MCSNTHAHTCSCPPSAQSLGKKGCLSHSRETSILALTPLILGKEVPPRPLNQHSLRLICLAGSNGRSDRVKKLKWLNRRGLGSWPDPRSKKQQQPSGFRGMDRFQRPAHPLSPEVSRHPRWWQGYEGLHFMDGETDRNVLLWISLSNPL